MEGVEWGLELELEWELELELELEWPSDVFEWESV